MIAMERIYGSSLEPEERGFVVRPILVTKEIKQALSPKKITGNITDALVVVDLQNDFCPGGSLAVKEGDKIVDPLNRIAFTARRLGLPIIFTRDWHPKETTHFVSGGGIWPEHCVKDTRGAEFHERLIVCKRDQVVSKGMGEKEDAYSGFEARNDQGEMLEQILRRRGVERIFVGGLATDYCVKATVLDGVKLGFKVVLVEDGIRAVNLQKDDGDKAVEEMRRSGVKVVTSSQVDRLWGF